MLTDELSISGRFRPQALRFLTLAVGLALIAGCGGAPRVPSEPQPAGPIETATIGRVLAQDDGDPTTAGEFDLILDQLVAGVGTCAPEPDRVKAAETLVAAWKASDRTTTLIKWARAIVAVCGGPLPPNAAPTIAPADGAASFIAFRTHLATASGAFAAAAGQLAADLSAGKEAATNADTAMLATLTATELSWLNAHRQADCYSIVWIDWQLTMYAAQRAAAALVAGDSATFDTEMADATDVAGVVATDLGYAGANCGVPPVP